MTEHGVRYEHQPARLQALEYFATRVLRTAALVQHDPYKREYWTLELALALDNLQSEARKIYVRRSDDPRETILEGRPM